MLETFRRYLSLALVAALALTTATPIPALGREASGPDPDALGTRFAAATLVEWRHAAATPARSGRRATETVQILGLNDFHGALPMRDAQGRPLRTVGGQAVGGAAVLAAYLRQEEATAPERTLVVHAGDHVGASHPSSALLQDEPSISVMNLLANRFCKGPADDNPKCNVVGTLGNHEFDDGVAEIMRLIKGGNYVSDDPERSGPFLEDPWGGAKFPYVSANVVDTQTGRPILPPYVIRKLGDARVAVIGAVLEGTPTIVTPSGVAGVEFLDEATAINRYVPEIRAQGVEAIVVTIHQGTSQPNYVGPTRETSIDAAALGGDIGPIVNELDDAVDLVVTGHWHQFTNALVRNKNGAVMLVTQAFANSTAFADIELEIDLATRDVIRKSASVVTTFWTRDGRAIVPDGAVARLVGDAEARVEPIVNQVIGESSVDVLRGQNAAGESALGDLIADAQRAAMSTDMAFMNPGGIRQSSPDRAKDGILVGPITWGELFTIQPFGNDLVKMELTGAQVLRLLEQQFQVNRVLQISGLTYAYHRPSSGPVQIHDVMVQGQPLDAAATYSVTVNSFLSTGGDGFAVLTEGTNRVVGPVDLNGLVSFIKQLPNAIVPAEYGVIQGRITRLSAPR